MTGRSLALDVGVTPVRAPASGSCRRRTVVWVLAAALGAQAAAGLLIGTRLGFRMVPVQVGPPTDRDPGSTELGALEAEVSRGRPRDTYIVIDRANNRLWVRDAGAVKLEAVVSTGSGTILRESGGRQRSWTFDTPTGRFEVRSERRHPAWVKPDWAFLEEGEPVPRRPDERVDRSALGEWALDLGDGYMIHGTLYERLLGRSITHGCIRVGRDDLRVVARVARIGTPVYIF